jgi:hypothetical protein
MFRGEGARVDEQVFLDAQRAIGVAHGPDAFARAFIKKAGIKGTD